MYPGTSKFMNLISGICLGMGKSTFKSKFNTQYSIFKISPAEADSAAKVLVENFFDEPFLNAIGVRPSIESVCLFGKFWIQSLQEDNGLSLKVCDKWDNKVKGVVHNSPFQAHENYTRLMAIANQVKIESLRNLFLAWACISLKAKIPKCARTIMEISDLAVDRDCRGKGVADNLVKESIKVARLSGFDYVKVDATNPITGKICTGNNFDLIWEEEYRNFVGVEDTEENREKYVRVYLKDVRLVDSFDSETPKETTTCP